ncbi:MAG: succinate dehydrogenase assembly factor 2 [Pseudomonadota bacterium]|nr:succinate dehydrogenase assembly factor 2 [Alphaproteobacteria bacterium]MEC7702802.1 succinate dehydrogenase assembly factor 2 [Pseudomonadota bacterium]MEC9236028.1 succinate dehydrogenase assembly factor 2 [Pseudomonadota bacterium]MED5422515.1 succinate dehydrogenase assembly factor 2 [Pseudomonadota bacterium]
MDNRRKKLLFRSWHRGTKEMDIILGNFAEKHLAALDDTQLDAYESLLEVPDPDIYNWVTGKNTPPANEPYSSLVEKIINNKVYEA